MFIIIELNGFADGGGHRLKIFDMELPRSEVLRGPFTMDVNPIASTSKTSCANVLWT
jgi:hypothetical protein